jgi:hypothetical protein
MLRPCTLPALRDSEPTPAELRGRSQVGGGIAKSCMAPSTVLADLNVLDPSTKLKWKIPDPESLRPAITGPRQSRITSRRRQSRWRHFLRRTWIVSNVHRQRADVKNEQIKNHLPDPRPLGPLRIAILDDEHCRTPCPVTILIHSASISTMRPASSGIITSTALSVSSSSSR